ncbi:hypothetical protein ACEN2I_18620 [Flavobacterium sp. W22_SRS_FK3]|uniref:hypothetical protein n=1 Tax=Flavobacterium sp. W22_SRS_FK3 TaxID=3240275 RepID=UPI003F9370E9
MRRLTLFLIFLNFLLLSGGQYLNAETLQNSAHNYGHKHRVKYTNQDQGSSIIEEADLDLDDEYLGDDAHENDVVNKFFAANYSLLDNWYLTFSDQIIVNYHSHFKFFVPFCGHSNPIYITQRVLRI